MSTSKSKPLLLVALALAAAVALLLVFFDTGGGAAGAVAPAGVSEPAAAAEPVSQAVGRNEPDRGASASRAAVAASAADPELDPAIRAALCGFRGRVVDHAGAPLPGLAVELFRAGADSLFGEEPTPGFTAAVEPKLDAGRAVTDEGGRFTITGVWPEAFYVLLAGVGAESTGMVIVDQTPGPGEIVDLGDIRLDLTATVVGVVVGDEGEPVAGALVRAADVPGAFTTMVPLERLDPEGAVILYEGAPKRVIDFPAWIARAYERLPIPRTHTGADGSFRLTGVRAGNNLLAITAPGRLSHVEPRLSLEAGRVKDIGEVRLRVGDEVFGRVVDGRGGPVAGAEVLVGQVIGIAPIAFAARTEPTNADGEFSLTGFRGGKVIAAARRRPGDPWTVGEAQPVVHDVLLQLPGAFELTVRVKSAAGAPIEGAELRLLPGAGEEGMAQAARFGFFAPADLGGRLRSLGEGRYVVGDLVAGSYRLEVTAPGHDVASMELELAGDLTKTVQLEPVSTGTVVVVDDQGAPVRHAAVHCKSGERSEGLPRFCGRTGADGRFALEQVAAGPVMVFAHHPAFGWVSAKGELPAAEIRLVMRAPGGLRGTLTEDGEPPELGKYMVVVVQQDDEDDTGSMPRLAAPDPRGAFEVRGLQPGSYRLVAVPSVRAIRSLGSIFEMAQQAMFFGTGSETVTAEVASRAVAEARIDVRTEREPVDGPSASVRGTVLINGRPGVDMMVMTRSSGRRSAEVDAAGRFDLGPVAAGPMTLRLYDTRDAGALFSDALWQKTYDLEAGRDLDVVIDLSTGALAGRILAPDGGPATRCEVELSGAPLSAGGSLEEARVELEVASDDAGEFRFEQVPAGTYELLAKSHGGRGARSGVQVVAGATTGGVEIVLQRTFTVSGRIDVAALGAPPPRWMWLELAPVDPRPPARGRSTSAHDDGAFEVSDVSPGRYRVEISAYFPDPRSSERWGGNEREYVVEGVVEVGSRDLEGVVLVPVPKEPEEPVPAAAEPAGEAGKSGEAERK